MCEHEISNRFINLLATGTMGIVLELDALGSGSVLLTLNETRRIDSWPVPLTRNELRRGRHAKLLTQEADAGVACRLGLHMNAELSSQRLQLESHLLKILYVCIGKIAPGTQGLDLPLVIVNSLSEILAMRKGRIHQKYVDL